MRIQKGQIYYANLPIFTGHTQRGTRPVVIISNNIGNVHSPTVIVACITSQIKKTNLPTHLIFRGSPGKIKTGMILCEQIYTIDKSELLTHIGNLTEQGIQRLNIALKDSLEID